MILPRLPATAFVSCTEHRDRKATHVVFSPGFGPGTAGALMTGTGGWAHRICERCKADTREDYAVSAYPSDCRN